MIKFYNTLGRKIDSFEPLSRKIVTLYTCGPTVYDFPQIGNLRAFVFDDTLRRMLEVSGYKIKHVMNITDVGHLTSDEDEGDDKLETGAKRENKSVWEVAEYYTEAFKTDMKQLNVLPPNGYTGQLDNYARATDFIDDQIAMVKLLIDKGFAYLTKQAIYFDISKLSDYGELTGQKLADKELGARSEIVIDDDKRHAQDFAVWFFTVGRFEGHSMHWSSPWGEGFPGWHLECSAIIHATLGEPIDIHTGGVDHIGTHHPNEIAQTKAAFGLELANYWLHNEFLLVEGQKMGKSKGNFVTLQTIVDKHFKPMALRLLFLQIHYRSQMNFTWTALEAAQIKLFELQAFADLRYQLNPDANLLGDDYFESKQKDLIKAVQNDLNTASALVKLYQVVNHVMVYGKGLHQLHDKQFQNFLVYTDKLLGLNLLQSKDITGAQKQLISEREAARKTDNWSQADKIRQLLSEQGVEINDTGAGPLWQRKSV